MSSSLEQYGFDATFISDIAEYLKCVVCHLVLRKPIQIMKCGHRFCEPCFERIKGYAKHQKTDLCCPIDKDIIDINKVFEDTGMARIIGNLKVQCSNNARGCVWIDDLRDLQVHEEQCQCKLVEASDAQQSERDSNLIRNLCKRIAKCEESLMEKEEDAALLKSKEEDIEKEMHLMREHNTEWKDRLEKDIDSLSLKNQLLEKELLETKKLLDDKQAEMDATIAAMKKDIEGNRNLCLEEKQNVADQFNNSMNLNNFLINNEVGKLQGEIRNVNEQFYNGLKGVKDEVNSVKWRLQGGVCLANVELQPKRTLLDNSLCRASPSTSTYAKPTNDYFNPLDGKLTKGCENINSMNNCQDDVKEAMKRICDLEEHITNVENIFFCGTLFGSRDIVLQWKLSNYQHYFNIGEVVYSPIFYTQIKGYTFKLKVKWVGEEKENLALALHLCRGMSYSTWLEPFNIPFSLRMVDKNGVEKSRNVPLSDINDNRERNFTLHPSEDESRQGWGFLKFLTTNEVENYYLVNDMLTIKCKLTPPQ